MSSELKIGIIEVLGPTMCADAGLAIT
jgi:hypothetical protein